MISAESYVFAKTRHVVAILLTGLLVSPPGWGAAQKPLGVILQAQNATLRASDGIAGTTIFAGDTVSTGHSGSMLVRMGAAQVEVMADSVVSFEEFDSGIAGANLVQGTVGFATPETGTVAVRAAGMVIRPQPQRLTQGRVTVVGPSELLVTSYRGPLDVSMGNESLTIPEGTTYRVQGDSKGPGPVGAGAEAARPA